MALRLMVLVALILLLQGCFVDDSSPLGSRPVPPPQAGTTLLTPEKPPESINACAPNQDDWDRITQLYEATELSIHELITCGRVQVGLSKSLLAIVLASNRDLFHGDAFQTLSTYAGIVGLDLTTPFSRAEDGRWAMPIDGASSESRFWVQFFKPGSAEPILADPFDLESYLVNARIETIYSLEEMIADFELRNHFLFYFDEAGPLADLLNDGAPLSNPFVVTVSIADIAALVSPQFESDGNAFFGALVSLVDAEMISCVELFDHRGATQVEYRADGRRDTVGEIAGSGEIGFDVDEIFATDGAFELVGEASELRYLGIKSLAGRIIYDVVASGGLTIESDFRSGNAWPVTRFLCEDPG